MERSQSYWEAKARYQKNKRKLISADVPKETGEMYKSYATTIGVSMSSLIRQAVDEFIARHASEKLDELNQTQPAQIVNAPPKLTGDEKRLVDAFNNLSPKAQKTLIKFLDALQD